MGNCWATPVDDVSINTRPQSPAQPGTQNNRNSTTNHHHRSTADEGGSARAPAQAPAASCGQIITPNLKMFTLSELRSATRNFRPDSVLGQGGFGTVYKGWIDEKTLAPSRVAVGMPVAVKRSSPDSEQGLKEWQAEIKFLGKFSHPNLVKLLGYCWEERQFLLVYEYMQRGSLESHLFRKGAGETIAWDRRIKIAIGAAKGLSFLHSTEKSVIFRDFKASNILLDSEFNAKLSDFGLAKLGPVDGNSHVSTKAVGTYGYAAPEYLATGHLYLKSDVYGFGVVLLELITGLRVLDLNRPGGQTNLVDWARPSLPDKKKLRKLIDPRLMGHYPSKAAYATAQLVLRCIEHDHKRRPNMEQVLHDLVQISNITVKTIHPVGGGGGGGGERRRRRRHTSTSQAASPYHHQHHGTTRHNLSVARSY